MTRYSRRIQKIGSSMIISLPVEWVKGNKIEKGDIIDLEINQDNSVSVLPPTEIIENISEVTIQVTESDKDSLVNHIYGAYLLGFNVIKIKGRESISFDTRENIKNVTRNLMGLEIIDENSSGLTLQFLLDMGTLNAEKILRRMSSIIIGMQKDAFSILKNHEKNIQRIILSRDDEVDRQYFLLVRLIRSAMMEQKLLKKLNLTNIDILDYRIAANYLESMGDHIVDFADSISSCKNILLIELNDLESIIEDMHVKAISGFINRNRSDSIEVIKSYKVLDGLLNQIKEEYMRQENNPTDVTVKILNAIFSVDKAAKCLKDIADLVKPVVNVQKK